ncbi:hypothetical protein [Mycoplasmopsis synoviae]|uniref:Uncharacterized protein n=1 Tax=Mycoplasmopsis synoviae TaxID=2109 RepID=A0AAX3F206_MYCSY|nr:hypothetical protein [Mycoplasmopsis synoviae]UZW64355.1 hypothetical protein OIE46_03225 [Mycoplasmopsis synoviae]
MKLIDNISKLLKIEKSELLKKFELPENASKIDFLNKLGVYSVFDSKEELTEYISKKTKNIQQKFEEFEKQKVLFEAEKENLKSLNEILNSNFQKAINSEIKKIDFVKKIEFKDLDFEDLDFENLNSSILNQAQKNGWKIKEKPQNLEIQNDSNQENVFYFKNGGVTKY